MFHIKHFEIMSMQTLLARSTSLVTTNMNSVHLTLSHKFPECKTDKTLKSSFGALKGKLS